MHGLFGDISQFLSIVLNCQHFESINVWLGGVEVEPRQGIIRGSSPEAARFRWCVEGLGTENSYDWYLDRRAMVYL